MEALKFVKNPDFKKNVEEARNFFQDLARERFGLDFQLNESFDGIALVQLQNHFKKYSLLDKNWKHPRNGLLIVASIESEASMFFVLLNFYLSKLCDEEKKKFDGIKSRFEGDLLKINIISTRDIVLDLFNKVKVETILKNSDTNFLCLMDFGQEAIVNLDYYNKLDIASEILRIRYQKRAHNNSKQVTYLLTHLTFDELNKRYGSSTLFHMNKLIDFIILNNPKN